MRMHVRMCCDPRAPATWALHGSTRELPDRPVSSRAGHAPVCDARVLFGWHARPITAARASTALRASSTDSPVHFLVRCWPFPRFLDVDGSCRSIPSGALTKLVGQHKQGRVGERRHERARKTAQRREKMEPRGSGRWGAVPPSLRNRLRLAHPPPTR